MKNKDIRGVRLQDGLVTAMVASESKPGEYYSVAIDLNNMQYMCSCLGNTTHKTMCKHIRRLLGYLYKRAIIKPSEFKTLREVARG